MWCYTHLIDLTGAQQLLVWKQQTGSKSALGLTENMCTEGNGAHFSVKGYSPCTQAPAPI